MHSRQRTERSAVGSLQRKLSDQLSVKDERSAVGSQLKNVQRKLGCARASLGSLSEAVEVFEPERLCGIIESLAAEVKPVRDVRSGHLGHTLTAVDGSVVKTLKSIAEAAFMNDKNGDSHSG